MRRASGLISATALLVCALLGSATQAQSTRQTLAPAPARLTPPARFLADDEAAPEPEILPTALLQPSESVPAPAVERRTPPTRTSRASTTTRRPPTRLASVPNMFGDFFGGGPVLTATQFDNSAGVPTIRKQFQASIVPSGGGRRAKIGEQNKALPEDRIYFFYNHFENAQGGTNALGQTQRFPIDRYTFGGEKTFFDGLASVELRMPFSNAFSFTGDPANPGDFTTEGGQIGNLVVIPKVLLYQSESTAFAAGLGIELPTGEDVDTQFGSSSIRFANEAVHLSPYLAAMHQSTERLYWLGFAQLDLATNGNRVFVTDPFLGDATLGSFTDQNLLFLDLAGGYSFYVNPEARWLTRLSAQVEAHYAGTLQNADSLDNARGLVELNLAPATNQVNMVNLTFALTGTLGQDTFVRLGTSAPVTNQLNRFFDSEIQAAIIRRF